MNESQNGAAVSTFFQLALDLKTQWHNKRSQWNCQETHNAHVHMRKCTYTNSTEQQTTLNIKPVKCLDGIRHLRWFWRQRTSQFRGLCSNTTTRKVGLSHQVFPPPTTELDVFHSCILCVKTIAGLH